MTPLAKELSDTNKRNWLNNPETADYANELRQRRETIVKNAIALSMADSPNLPLMQQHLIRAFGIDEQLKILTKI